jgi:tetratricopeptide (TPR) repeat protein
MLQEAAKRAERKIAEMNQPAEQNQPSPPEEEQPSGRNELSKIDKETAEATIGIHKSFATQAKDKFNFYMRTAEELLKQGKYYHAVDAYTLAGIYKPDDPLAYAGKAHALFASGEYMSSTYFLAKAINIFPQYVEFKIDLNAMIPDKERLDSRIADIRQWADKTKSAELNFLLAYIYYQLDKKEPAQEAIKAVAEKIPDSVAVKALQQAIEKK